MVGRGGHVPGRNSMCKSPGGSLVAEQDAAPPTESTNERRMSERMWGCPASG